MQAAEFASTDDARRVEAELQTLIGSYIAFDGEDPRLRPEAE